MDNNPINKGGPRLVTVNQLVQLPDYRWTSKSSIRHYINDAEPRQNSRGEEIPGNGMLAAIIRIGRKVLIDLDEFDAWVDRQREAEPVSSTRIVERRIDRREIGILKENESATGTVVNHLKGSIEEPP